LSFTALCTLSGGCATAPDGNSGGDAHRNEAQVIPLEDWATGELNREGGDATDWKRFAVGDATNLKVEASAEVKGTTLQFALYDQYGRPIGGAEVKGGGDVASLSVKVTDSPLLFLKVAQKGGPKTVYSVRAVVAEEGGGGSGGPDL
jgi:hypothetical protein